MTLDINGDLVESARMAQGIWKGWMVMPLLYFFMIFVIEKEINWWSRVFMALAVSGLGLSFWAIFQMVTGDFSTWDGRASGPFESANYLSLYLAPILGMAFIQWSRQWRHFGWGVVSLVLATGLWGTESYAAFIAVAAGVAFFILLNPHFTRRQKTAFFVSGAVTVSFLIGLQWNTPKFQQFLDFSNRTSSSVRVEVYTIARELIHRHPLLGIGLGQFEVQYQLNAPEILGHAPYEWVMLHPHNLFLAWWLNTGLLGLVAMLWLVGAVFWKGLHCEHDSFLSRWFGRMREWVKGPELQIRLVGLSMLVVTLAHGLFDTPFFKNDLAYLWWLVLVMGI